MSAIEGERGEDFAARVIDLMVGAFAQVKRTRHIPNAGDIQVSWDVDGVEALITIEVKSGETARAGFERQAEAQVVATPIAACCSSSTCVEKTSSGTPCDGGIRFFMRPGALR